MAPHIFSYLRKDHQNVQRLSLDSLLIASDTEASTLQGRESTASSGKNAASAQISSSSSCGDISDDTIITQTAAAPNPLKVWWLEGLACLLAVSMLVTAVATVRPYHEKPLPKWPYNLSINTLVAIYFVTLKTALAFVLSQLLGQLKWASYEHPQPLHRLAQYDDASRGPWGSLTLLWRFRDRSCNLASGAAIVLVLATILDPFGQQIISFYSCPTQETNTNASVPTAHSLDTGIKCARGGDSYTGSCILAADIQAAIQVGMCQSSLSSPSFSCPTGECVFDTPYGSAGWCNSCTDVSDRLLFSTTHTSRFNFTSITLPPPPQYKYWELIESNHTIVVTSIADSVSTKLSAQLLYKSPTVENDLMVHLIYFNDSLGKYEARKDNLWMARGYGAAQCSIYPCLRKYKSKVSNGKLVEEILSETPDQWGQMAVPQNDLDVIRAWQWSHTYRSIEASCLDEAEIQQLRQHGYSFENLDRDIAWLKFDRKRVESPISKDMNDTTRPGKFSPIPSDVARVRRECIYEYGMEEMWTITDYLASAFNGTMEIEVSLRDNSSVWVEGPLYLQTLSQRGDISYAAVAGLVNRVTQALTTYARDASKGPENLVTGTMTKQDTCVRVDWAWIAFPSVLVAGMLIMVMATLVRVYRGGPLARQNYKTSVLPLMLHSLDRKDTYTAGLETMSKMEGEAKKVIVRLELTERGWRFRET